MEMGICRAGPKQRPTAASPVAPDAEGRTGLKVHGVCRTQIMWSWFAAAER